MEPSGHVDVPLLQVAAAVGALAAAGHLSTSVVVAVVVAGTVRGRLGRRVAGRPAEDAPVLYAVTAAGMYVTVPDTEQALPVALTFAAVAVAAGLGGAIRRVGPLAPRWRSAGNAPAVVLLTWVAGVGGAARPGAVVGALGAFGLLWLEPGTRRLAGTVVWDGWPVVPRRLARIGAHGAVVAVATRVAGLRQDAFEAAGIVLLLSCVALHLLGPRRQGSPPTPRAVSA